MNRIIVMTAGIVLLVLLLLFSSTYTVAFHEVAIKSTFGQSSEDDVISEPGLKFKLPIFADRVNTIDTRLQYLQSPDEEILTADQQTVVVRGFLMWKVDVDNALVFDRSYDGLDQAESDLRTIFRDALSSAVSQFAFDELLGSESRLAEAEQAVVAQLGRLTGRGIEPVAVGISQLQLPPKATTAVLQRMNATQSTLAEAARSKGKSEAERIDSQATTLASTIRSFAQQRAEAIRAQSNERKREIYEEMSEDEELAIFLTWLDTYRAILSGYSTFVVETNRAPFHLADPATKRTERGIPMPEESYMLADEQPAGDGPAGDGPAGEGDEADDADEGG